MKPVYIFLSLLLAHNICNAQYDNANKRDSLKILNARYSYHSLTADKNEHSDIQLAFDSIIFKDVRYDTSFVSMKYPLFNLTNTYNTKIDFYGGFANNLTNYFNDYYSINGGSFNAQLVCYIKRFAITLEHDVLEHFNAGNLKEVIANDVNIEIECYYKMGGMLYPATRHDTSYTAHFRRLALNEPSDVKELLRPLMDKIEKINPGNVVKRKSYTEAEITERYAGRFNIPILTTGEFKKGVYKSFNEFKNNSPSIDSFTVKTDKMKVNAGNAMLIDATSLITLGVQKRNTAVFLYDKQDKLISPSEIFGYCDGKTAWIQHGAFFYPLVKTGNAFEFIYIFHYSDQNKRTQTLYLLTPLNMETGHSN